MITKTNKKILIVSILFLIILGGIVLAFQKNSLKIENNENINLKSGGFEIESEENENNKVDNEIMLSVAGENENKAEAEKERELKFRESVKKLVEEIKIVFGFADDKNINSALETLESQREIKIIKVPDDYKSIQLAIDSASAGDRIEVSVGEYQENIVMKEGVSLIGLSVSVNKTGEEETELNSEASELSSVSSEASAVSPFSSLGQAILDGGNFGNVVSFKNGITGKTELAGFTIRNAGKSLSGVFVENSSPWIHDNAFIDNEYGIYIKGKSSPVIQKNVIQFSNKGIEVFNFEKMEEKTELNSEKTELSSVFSWTNPIIIDNLITDNKIGIDLYQASAVINHNAISYNNHYKIYLGATYGIYLSKSSAEIANNIITDSGICELCAGVNADKESKNVVLKYNNIWNNKNNFVCFGECVMEDNNISEEPLFVDYISGSYKLSEDSPLIGKAEDGMDIGVRW